MDTQTTRRVLVEPMISKSDDLRPGATYCGSTGEAIEWKHSPVSNCGLDCGCNIFCGETGGELKWNPEAEPEAEDVIVKPSHYSKWLIEPVTFIMRNGFEFWRGNIVKYASRAGFKIYDGMDEVQSEITDLKKVIRYAEMRINQLEGEAEL